MDLPFYWIKAEEIANKRLKPMQFRPTKARGRIIGKVLLIFKDQMESLLESNEMRGRVLTASPSIFYCLVVFLQGQHIHFVLLERGDAAGNRGAT